MLRVVFLLFIVNKNWCLQSKFDIAGKPLSNFFGDAKNMISSAYTYIELTKKAAAEFNSTYHQLENALNTFQSKDDVGVVHEIYNETIFKDCKCYCKCPHPSRLNVDPKTVDDMKNKILELRTKLLNVIGEKMETRQEDLTLQVDLKNKINIDTNSITVNGINLYLDLLLKFIIETFMAEENTLSCLTIVQPGENSDYLNKREKRSPMSHCSCSGNNDAQKEFEYLKGMADFVVNKINNFNAKLYQLKDFIKKIFSKIHLKKKINETTNYFNKTDRLGDIDTPVQIFDFIQHILLSSPRCLNCHFLRNTLNCPEHLVAKIKTVQNKMVYVPFH